MIHADSPVGVPGTARIAIDETFPRLTGIQIARAAMRGRVRHVEHGEVLSLSGTPATRVFLAVTATIEIVMVSEVGESVVRVVSSGEFTGEISILSGRRRSSARS